MPKTAVDEDGESIPREDDIRAHAHLADSDPVVHPISQALGM
jgi:hypothetical protein